MDMYTALKRNKKEIGWLGALILLAFAIRFYYCSFRTIQENWDSTSYLWLAQNIHEGNGFRLWPGAPLHTWFQPLYSLLISIAYPLFGNYETAGYFVSSFFGSLLLIPVFLLTRLLFSREAGFLAAGLVTFHYRMVEASTLILTEMTYSFFWLFGIYYAFKIIIYKERNSVNLIFCGVFLGMSSLIRTESNLDFFIFVALLIVIWFSQKFISVVERPAPPQRMTFAKLLLMAGSFAILMGPYIYFLYRQMGQFTLTGRTTRSIFIVMESENEQYEFFDESPVRYVLLHPSDALRRVISNGDYVLRKLSIWAFHPMVTLFMGLGLFGQFWSKTDTRKMLLLLTLLLFPWLTYYGVTGILNRYYTTSIILVLIIAANGIIVFYRWFKQSEGLSGLRDRISFLSNKNVFYGATIVLFLLIYIRAFTYPIRIGRFPEHGDQIKDYTIGKWISNNIQKENAGVLCASPRIAYYCKGRYFGDNDRKLNVVTLEPFARKHGINVIVVDDLFSKQWFPQLKVLNDTTNVPSYLSYFKQIRYRYDNGVEGTALIYTIKQ